MMLGCGDLPACLLCLEQIERSDKVDRQKVAHGNKIRLSRNASSANVPALLRCVLWRGVAGYTRIFIRANMYKGGDFCTA